MTTNFEFRNPRDRQDSYYVVAGPLGDLRCSSDGREDHQCGGQEAYSSSPRFPKH
jgi:hypothetical protein